MFSIAVLAASVSHAAEDSYRSAEAAIKTGDFDGGIAALRSLLKAQPDDLKANNLMGIALTMKGQPQAANTFFRTALKMEPGFFSARKNLAINELQLNEIPQAEQDFEAVLKAIPSDPVTNMYMGRVAFSQKDCPAALQHFNLAGDWLEKDKRLSVMRAECEADLGHVDAATTELRRVPVDQLDPATQYRAGYVLASADQYADAIPFFESARMAFGGNTDLNFNLALCYLRVKRFQDAIALLTADSDPAHRTADVDNLLSEAYEASGASQLAIDTLRHAISLAPADARNYVDLAILCGDHAAFDLGLEVIGLGLKHAPNSEDLLLQRGVLYAMSGRWDLAQADFENAGRTDAGRNSAALGLGLAYIQQGDTAEALTVLRKRIPEDPSNAGLQYLLAESLIRSGASPAEAQAALEKSVQLNPRFIYSRLDLAKIYLQQNEVDKGIRQLHVALEIDPSKVQTYAQLASALRKQGKLQESAAMFTKVRELNDYNRRHGQLAPLSRGAP